MVNLPDPIVPFGQGDLQQFLHGYSGILWEGTIKGFITISMELATPEIAMQLEVPDDRV